MSLEQRRYARQATQEDTIYSSMDATGMEPQRVYHPGTIINKSEGGVALRVATPHRIGELLWLEGVNGFDDARSAAVKWIQELESEEVFEVGVQF